MIRGQKVILDRDLAEMYGVETKYLNQAVSRNFDRFPGDFMFELNDKEFNNLKSQFVTSSWGGRRKNPKAFTEHGILMLSSVLRSKRAIETNITIIRVFNSMRKMLQSHEYIHSKINNIEERLLDYDDSIKELWFEFKKVTEIGEDNDGRKIGFRVE